MRAIVTGGLGFIGHHLVMRLMKDGWDVIVIDNLLTGDNLRADQFKAILTGGVSIFEDSVQGFCQGVDIEDLKDIDVVFHLAALPRVPVSFEQPELSLRNNIDSTIAALELARKASAVFVYSSSSSIYGTQDTMPLTEFMQPHPESPYALGKWVGEELCQQYHDAFNVSFIALRYFNVYGPGMTKGGYATAISTFLDQRAQGKPLTVTGDGLQERDFTHVDDVVEANILAARHLLRMDTGTLAGVISKYVNSCGAYNIGAGNPKVLLNVAKLISENITHIEARREPRKTHASSKKAEAILGWTSKANFEEKIKELLT